MDDLTHLLYRGSSLRRKQFQYLERRLNQWAEWILQGNDFGLGYPKKTIEAKMADTGGIWKKLSTDRAIPSNPNAEAMEHFIRELEKNYPFLAMILRMQYLAQGSPNEKAKKLKLSHTRYYSYLSSAKYWLDGYLRSK